MARKMMAIAGIIAVAIIGAGGVVVYSYYPRQAPSEEELPAEVILANQEDLPEVRAFLDKYPDAKTNVDRSGRLAADYRVDKSVDESSEYLRLRVFSDDDGNPQEMFVECYAEGQPRFTYDDIVNYAETETCLK
ncbi:MAG: hypothetical protein QXJ74_03550 [Nitrososphaera sp.]|uniref:hypothetical protein n=1 Tax=Nitrososphaera sp. TaxID=1971748 RepID=UPI00180992DD|nr:hypothetical protein [Nitrososphaera sp.]NWG36733.1 hypothetical protein [Nitrososphaera sp.]